MIINPPVLPDPVPEFLMYAPVVLTPSSSGYRITISAGDLSFIPTTKDRVLISNVEFKIVQVIQNEQNNTAISFDLILR